MDPNVESLAPIIKEIVENMEIGQNSYFNPISQEFLSIPSMALDPYGDGGEFFQEEIDIISERGEEFIEFEVLDSSDSFRIMENFVYSLSPSAIKNKLEHALSNSKPFKNFNFLIHESDAREDWFEFRKQAYKEIVITKLEVELPDFLAGK